MWTYPIELTHFKQNDKALAQIGFGWNPRQGRDYLDWFIVVEPGCAVYYLVVIYLELLVILVGRLLLNGQALIPLVPDMAFCWNNSLLALFRVVRYYSY